MRLPIALLACFAALGAALPSHADDLTSPFSGPSTVKYQGTFNDAGPDARGITPGTFGAQYGRMLHLSNGNWMAVYTFYDNDGYTHDSQGGTRLGVSLSSDNARSWTQVSTLSDPGRDLDNGQLVQLSDGSVLLAARSVIWQQSYELPVYRGSSDETGWSKISTIDQNEGEPGSLGNPDKGVYEPHMDLLPNGSLAVMYANEKHVTEGTPYSQIISEKISSDGGNSWGSEIFVAWDPNSTAARPGMPVWTQMANGSFIVVFELCATDNCNIHFKTSTDGVSWTSGLGNSIPNQANGPYIIRLSDGRLAVTSSGTNNISFSADYGTTWIPTENTAFPGGFTSIWSSIYQTGPNELAAMSSPQDGSGGNLVQIKFASLNNNPVDQKTYRIVSALSQIGNPVCLDDKAGSSSVPSAVQIWTCNNMQPQNWTLHDVGGGFFTIVNQQNGLCLDDSGGDQTPGTPVQQYTCLNADTQYWRFDANADGSFRLFNQHSSLNLDVPRGDSTPGNGVQLYTSNGLPPQNWILSRQ